jgi:serine/threonine protein kinase
MALVYLGVGPDFRREIASKVLPREALNDPVLFKRFRREAGTRVALEPSVIVPVYDYDEDDGRPFLSMGYLSGVHSPRLFSGRRNAGCRIPVKESLNMECQRRRACPYA